MFIWVFQYICSFNSSFSFTPSKSVLLVTKIVTHRRAQWKVYNYKLRLIFSPVYAPVYHFFPFVQIHFSIQAVELKLYLYVNICTGILFLFFFILPHSVLEFCLPEALPLTLLYSDQLSFPFPFPTYLLYMLILWLSWKLIVYLSSICPATEKPGSLHSGALCLWILRHYAYYLINNWYCCS